MTVTPAFNKSSYLEYSMLITNSRSNDIQIVFNPARSNGIIFYSGNHSHQRDFLSISLLERYVHFRFDLGSGLANIVSAEPVELEEWHTVCASRNGKSASLKVDNQLVIEALSPGMLQELNVVGDVSLGGIESFDIVSPLSGLVVGFTGCVRSMQVNTSVACSMIFTAILHWMPFTTTD